MPNRFDVVVVGAGPAGVAGALRLAGRGLAVCLIERPVCGGQGDVPVLVSALALSVLDDLGIESELAGHPIHAARLGFRRGVTATEILDQPIRTVSRRWLISALLDRARDSGVTIRRATAQRIVQRQSDCVFNVRRGRVLSRIVASFGINARGTAYQDPTGIGQRGFISTAKLCGLSDPGTTIHIDPPRLSRDDPQVAWYHWWAPSGNSSAIACVGSFGPTVRPGAVKTALDTFVTELREHDPRFRRAVIPTDGVASGPVNCGFTAAGCAEGRILNVGDATGLTSPFTGEGIGFALESARLAADILADQPNAPDDVNAHRYRRELSSRYVGYFEAGRHCIRRYRLTCRVLDSTITDVSPLFLAARHTTLLPELTGQRQRQASIPEHVTDAIGATLPLLRPVLADTNRILLGTVRDQWPFLARWLVARLNRDQGIPRPALLVSLSALPDASDDPKLPQVAAAVELAALAAIAGLSIDDERPLGDDRIDWANMVAILSVDFLLSTSARLAATVDSEFASLLLHWSGRIARARVKTLSSHSSGGTTFAPILYRSLFELPCAAGARRTCATRQRATALAQWARHAAQAAEAYDDAVGLLGQPTRLGVSRAFALRKRLAVEVDGAIGSARHTTVSSAEHALATHRLDLARRAARRAEQIGTGALPPLVANAFAALARTICEPVPSALQSRDATPATSDNRCVRSCSDTRNRSHSGHPNSVQPSP